MEATSPTPGYKNNDGFVQTSRINPNEHGCPLLTQTAADLSGTLEKHLGTVWVL